jgi:hypothetical protein
MGRGKIAALAATFLIAATLTAWQTASYLLTPFYMASCSAKPPRPGDVLVACYGSPISGPLEFYYTGSIFLNIDRELVEGLKAADVVILGNSRTWRTFRAPSIDRYFKSKGLRYFVLATEGSGFRFSQLTLENVGARPKILLVNNEVFYVDVLEDTYREFVLSPDRFRPAFSAFYYSRWLQTAICGSSMEMLKKVYCEGKYGSWRSTIDGTSSGNPSDPAGNFPVHIQPETRGGHKGQYMANERAFLASPSAKGCTIQYVVPWNDASVGLARSMAADFGEAFVFPQVDGLFTSDNSHLLPESSERWAREFVKALDPAIDACLSRK